MRPASIAVIFNTHKDHILLVKRRDVPIWVLPGGGIDPGEEPSIACKREAKEETGAKCRVVRKVAEYSPKNRLSQTTYLFELALEEETQKKTDETLNIQFFPLNKLPKTLFPLHKEWIDDALKEKKEIIYRPIEGVNYWLVLKYLIRYPILSLRYFISRLGFPINSNKDSS